MKLKTMALVGASTLFAMVSAAAAAAPQAREKAALADTMFPKTAVAPKVGIRAYPFNLRNVRLLDGPFKQAMERDLKYMLSLEPRPPPPHVPGRRPACRPRPSPTAAGRSPTSSSAATPSATSCPPPP